ncbi:MAG: hypothetical protein J5852_06560 [Clostridia bacterium]|nr:hypothetical protein [Clostridia bacterium]
MNIDIKLVAHAKDYIDDLARGINPLNKEAVNDNDVINDVKISRCFFYVSDILEAVIEGDVKKPKKPKPDPFVLQKLDLDGYGYSTEPISVSVITRKINELKPEEMENLKATAITNWLVDINMLSVIQINGKRHKRPTASGESIGITLEKRDGQNGPYYAVLYSKSAQHFIIDNLTSVIDGGYNNRQRKTNIG